MREPRATKFYEIYNISDGYSYIGVTDYSVAGRIFDHFSKWVDHYNHYNHKTGDPEGINLFEWEWLRETLYGRGPFYTKVPKLAAAIQLYGFESFKVKLLARGVMGRRERYSIENDLIFDRKLSYNVVSNSYTSTNTEYINLAKNYSNSGWVTYDTIGVDMFDPSGMHLKDVEQEITDRYYAYEDSLVM